MQSTQSIQNVQPVRGYSSSLPEALATFSSSASTTFPLPAGALLDFVIILRQLVVLSVLGQVGQEQLCPPLDQASFGYDFALRVTGVVPRRPLPLDAQEIKAQGIVR